MQLRVKMSLSKLKSKDFISWDDIQLTETEWELSSGEHGVIEEEIRECLSGDEMDRFDLDLDTEMMKENICKPKKRKMTKKNTAEYKCPECGKILKTIPGFRGHVDRQHQKPHLKAHDHKLTVTPETPPQSTTPSSRRASTPLCATQAGPATGHSVEIPLTNLPDLLHHMPTILASVFNDLDATTIGEELASHSQHLRNMPLTEFVQILAELFLPVVRHLGQGTSMARDRETMWKAFHALRFDTAASEKLAAIICQHDVPEECALVLVQVVLEDTMTGIIAHQVTLLLSASDMPEENEVSLSDGDQKVLYHICGYLLHSLRRRYGSVKSNAIKHLMTMIACLGTKSCDYEDESDFLDDVRRWTQICDRGGLIYAKQEFFLMIRQMEILLRRNTDITDLSAFSMNKQSLNEILTRDFLVKYYMDKLFSVDSEGHKLILLNKIVGIFLKLRGHAITKYVRRQTQKEKRDVKAGKRGNKASLRKSLRDPESSSK